MAGETQHILSIPSLSSYQARDKVHKYLMGRLQGKEPAEVSHMLDTLPLVITRRATTDTARRIHAELTALGAEVSVQPPLPEMAAGASSGLELDLTRASARFNSPQDIPPGEMWDRRKEVGLGRHSSAPGKMFCRSHVEFFATMPRDGTRSSPFRFALFWGVLGMAGSMGVQALMQPIYADMFGEGVLGEIFAESASPGGGVAGTIAILILSPLILYIALLIQAAIYHVGVLIFQGAGNFATTYRIVAYSTAAGVFQIVPILGALVSGLYSLYLLYRGLRGAHDLSRGRAIGAVLAPMLLIMALVGGLVFIAIMAGAIAGNGD